MAYTTLLHVGLNAYSGPHDVEAKIQFVKELVEECSDEGLVSSSFVRGIANCPIYYQGWTIEESTQLTNELFSEWPVPSSWTRNVPDKFLPKDGDAERTTFDILGSRN